MTIIVYRDGVMAADRQFTLAGCAGGQSTKIARRSDGALVGATGDMGRCAAFMRWFLAGEDEATRPSLVGDAENYSVAVVVRSNGVMEEHSRFGWAVGEGPFFAYGSGLEAALGALHMGADARRAVEVACRVVNGCGGGIDVLRLHDAKQWRVVVSAGDLDVRSYSGFVTKPEADLAAAEQRLIPFSNDRGVLTPVQVRVVEADVAA